MCKKETQDCEICLTNKYERRPNKQPIGAAPIPNHVGEHIHLDLFHMNGNTYISTTDKTQGSALKIITGTPDHDDLIEIKTGLKMLIENGNKQKKINSQFERILETLDPKTITDDLVMTEVYNELSSVANTINFAKNGNFYSGTLNLKDIQQIVSNEALDSPLIILEYSDIHVCYFNHAMILLDSKIAKCNNVFAPIEKCKNYVGNYICKIKNSDNCTINTLENKPAKCKVIHENNAPLEILEKGNIITDYNHTWNNIKIDGPKLIQFNYSATIDGKQYSNLQQEYKDAIYKQHDDQLEVLRIIGSKADYNFSNIEEMSTFLIPIEEHPVQYTFYCILGLCTLALLIYGRDKLCKCYIAKKAEARRKRIDEMYQIELFRLQQEQYTR
ncbi:PREDICTED: uncharacterized protein LOC108365501 [Rhagoletis zephyria]|uniref:uncharacterized protein LOC108365501 n=1 Tax=Rhagoletis zephyria TaxID=28612 RepID=UPI0008117C0B|nr:PREDICTED: uncharacterized protein LOC108365501 [Rhagoletis zephyria]